MSKPRDDRQKDLLLPALDQIIDMGHPLVRLAALIGSSGASRRSSASRRLQTEVDTLIGTLEYGPLRVATGTMGYKHRDADLAGQGRSRGAELPSQDHSPHRRQSAHL
jgi:hypothetical protein